MQAKCIRLPAVLIVSCACCTLGIAPGPSSKLNDASLRFAAELIERGDFVADKRNAWSDHQPSAEEENEFIRVHGFTEYAKWHLGIDARHGENTKARYKFPYGDFKSVHRCALIAIRSRAREYGYVEIKTAAAELQRKLERKAKIIR